MKRLISILLILCMVFGFTISSFATTIVNRTTDYSILEDFVTISEDQQELVNRVDKRANELFDYYRTNGKFPSMNDEMALNNFDFSIASSEAVPALTHYGIYITESNLTIVLAQIGIIIGSTGALPLAALLAILGGVYLGGVFTVAVYNNRAEIAATMNRYAYRGTLATSFANAAVLNDTIIKENKDRYNHYSAKRINNNGFGGIAILAAITESVAVTRLSKLYSIDSSGGSDVDVFSLTRSSASKISSKATSAIMGGTVSEDEAHTNYGVYNLPHFHVVTNLSDVINKLPGHSFFPY